MLVFMAMIRRSTMLMVMIVTVRRGRIECMANPGALTVTLADSGRTHRGRAVLEVNMRRRQ